MQEAPPTSRGWAGHDFCCLTPIYGEAVSMTRTSTPKDAKDKPYHLAKPPFYIKSLGARNSLGLGFRTTKAFEAYLELCGAFFSAV